MTIIALSKEEAFAGARLIRENIATLQKQNDLIFSKFTPDRMPVQFKFETKQREEQIAHLMPVLNFLDAIAKA